MVRERSQLRSVSPKPSVLRAGRLAVGATALALFGAAPPLPPMTTAELVAANNVRAHVEFLADDRLEGRDTGSRGHEIAASYVASRFRALGLEPGGAEGSWFVPVPLREASHAEAPQVTVTDRSGRRQLRYAVEVAVRPSLTDRHRSIDAALTFVGYGVDSPPLGLDDYRDMDVAGKIVVAFEGTPDGLPADIAAAVGSDKLAIAAHHGAIGLIEIDRSARGSQADDFRRMAEGAVLDWVDGEGRTGATPAGIKVKLALSPEIQARLFDGAPRSLAAVRSQLRNGAVPKGFALQTRMSVRAESRWREFSSPEVIGRLPGSDPRRSTEHVVMMAHLDHLGIKNDARPGEDAIYNGALDNSAGVATMIEVAREFAESGRPPARSLLFVANTGEERGLIGADYLANHPPVPIHAMVGAVDLDMPLALYDFTDVVAYGAEHSTIAATVAQAGRSMGIAVSPDPLPQEMIFTRSDHYRFVLQGVPAILLMTGFANGGETVWKEFLAHIYHSPRDDLRQPIEWRALARYGMLNYRIARALADAADRPRWRTGDFFGARPAESRAAAAR